MKGKKFIKLSFPKTVIGNLHLLQRLKRRRFWIESGKTSLLNTHAFTLVELLVVVLIIGILVAIALPQYQKAVERSRTMPAISLLKQLYQAQEAYYLEHGTYASRFNQLDINLPWEGNARWFSGNRCVARSNEEWSVEICETADVDGQSVSIGRLTGPYKGTGFVMYTKPNPAETRLSKGVIYCGECRGSACLYAVPGDGSYCRKVLGKSNRAVYPGAIRLFTTK